MSSMRENIYLDIKERLADSTLPYKSIELFRGQHENEKGDKAMSERPLILVEFGDTDWESQANMKQRSGPMPIRVHIILDVIHTGEDFMRFRFGFLEHLAKVLNGIGPGFRKKNRARYNEPMRRARDELERQPFKICHDVVEFRAVVHDDSAFQNEYQAYKDAAIKISSNDYTDP